MAKNQARWLWCQVEGVGWRMALVKNNRDRAMSSCEEIFCTAGKNHLNDGSYLLKFNVALPGK